MKKERKSIVAQNQQQPKSNGKSMIAIIVLSLLIVVIGGGYFVFTSENGVLGFGGEQEPVESSIPLEEFLINTEDDTMVRMEMTVTSYENDAEEFITADIAKVRDAVIHAVTNQPAEEIYATTEEGEFVIKDEIRQRINHSLGEEMIDDVLITNILMQ